MCLYPKLILNKKYLPNKKNNFRPPKLEDERFKFVPVGCGNCIECRKQKAQQWRVRLLEQIKVERYGYFVTLTFSNESLAQISSISSIRLNVIASKSVRLFLERVRLRAHRKQQSTNDGDTEKQHSTITPRITAHWFITELGQTNTERLHLHGILFTDTPITEEWLQDVWKYGRADIGDYCNERSINYIVKYMLKVDQEHKDYKPIVLCSAGIGKQYIERGKIYNRFADTDTRENYRLSNGRDVNLPIYYRNHIFSEEEREKLWGNKLDKHLRYVMGIEIDNVDTAEGERRYIAVRDEQRRLNRELGYGDDSNEWKDREYNLTARMLNKQERNAKARKGIYLKE